MKFRVIYSTEFNRDIKLINRKGWDLSLLKSTINILIEQGKLPKEYDAHTLKGEFKDCLECHINRIGY